MKSSFGSTLGASWLKLVIANNGWSTTATTSCWRVAHAAESIAAPISSSRIFVQPIARLLDQVQGARRTPSRERRRVASLRALRAEHSDISRQPLDTLRAFTDKDGVTRRLGTALTPELVERLSQRALAQRLGIALPFVTVDADGRPHPMLLSYLEVRAYDTGTVGLVIGARTRSAANLVERGTGTLLVIEEDVTVYVKLRTVDGPLEVAGASGYELGYFLLAVDGELEDAAAEWEGGMRITSPIRYAPAPSLDEPWAAATLAALAEPRARA